MPITAKEAQELTQATADMRAYADTLPPDSDERREYAEAIAAADAELRLFSAATAEPVTVPQEEEEPSPSLDDDTAEGLEALAASLRAEGYDVGDPPELVAGGAPRTFSRAADPERATLLREDVDGRVEALVDGGHLLPFQGDRVRLACYALLDATPSEGAPSGAGLRVYSRDEQGATPSGDRRAAVRDLLTLLGERDSHGLTRTYTRTAPDNAEREPVVLTVPDDVQVNADSADLAQRIQAFAKRENIPFGEAVKRYEREHGKVTLRKY